MAFQAALGSIVLHRTGKNRYAPALVNSMNEDGSLNLTVFSTNGQIGLARSVFEGPKEGDWAPPGIDAQEAAMAKAPPVSETGWPGETTHPSGHAHPPPLDQSTEAKGKTGAKK